MALFTIRPLSAALSLTVGRRLRLAAQLKAQKQELVAAQWVQIEENIKKRGTFPFITLFTFDKMATVNWA